MNNHQLPRGHTSLLSPSFKYVPAACTDLAKTFARVRGQNIEPQPWPERAEEPPGYEPELDIEVLEAAWLLRKTPRSGKPCRS